LRSHYVMALSSSASASSVCWHKGFATYLLMWWTDSFDILIHWFLVWDMVWDWFWGFQLPPFFMRGQKGLFNIFFSNFFNLHPILMGFFHCVPCKKIYQMDSSRHALSLTVFELQGGENWPRPNFRNFFICHPILMGFFSFDSLWKMHKKLLQAFFCIFYSFLKKRGLKGPKMSFSRVW